MTAASQATTAHSATVRAWLATMETAAGKSAPAAGITNPVTTKLENAQDVTQDGRDPGVCFRQHVAIQSVYLFHVVVPGWLR